MPQSHVPALRALLVCICLAAGILPSNAIAQKTPPNIVIILVDDAGFMDFGGYGGEARTPNIDRLGDSGVRFTNYHTSPLCSPSRAMLLTGLDNHRAGVGTIREVMTDSQTGQAGYSLSFEPGVLTIADRLQSAGYETFMTGKWHLGDGPGELPDSHGFDRSFVLDASGADNWEQKPYMPYYAKAPWYEDGRPADLPDDFYSSQFIVDKMIEYLEGNRGPDRPFLSYLSFQAVHIPVQAPREFTDGYNGVYDQGWDTLARQRWQRAREIGLIPDEAPMPDMPVDHVSWDSLSEEDQALMARSMQVHAGMLEAMDYHIGRLIDYLEQAGDLENTIFVITSDNGPEFNDPVHARGMGIWMALNGYHHDVDRLGERGSLAYIGPGWAAATASPGSHYKFFSSEGGTRVPLILSGPGVSRRGLVDELTMVTDIVPTLMALLASESGPDGVYSVDSAAFDGIDVSHMLDGAAGAQVPRTMREVGLEVSGNAAYFRGDFKLRRMTLPLGDASWKLFDVRNDPGETLDLSEARPELKAELLEAYQGFAEAFGVVALPDEFDVQRQVEISALAKIQARYFGPLVLGVLLMLILFILLIWGAIKLIRRA